MKLVVMSVRDRASDVFGRPYFSPSVGGAKRSFRDEINRVSDDNMLNRHPEDFDLYELGFFYDDEGTFELHDKPRQVEIGKDCVERRDA